jgi:hypothetical protein
LRPKNKKWIWDGKHIFEYFFSGFSLSSYLTEKGIANDTIPLDRHAISQLLHDTALAPYMMDEVCDQTVIPYYPNDKGWNKGKNMVNVFLSRKWVFML